MISFIKTKRKILIVLFLTIGFLSSLIDVLILIQRPQDVRSRANEPQESLPQFTSEFYSPSNQFKITFDNRLWAYQTNPQKTVFTLTNEYGAARLDITEGESKKDLESLKNDVIQTSKVSPIQIQAIQFKDKPSFLVSYKEQILGIDVFFYQQIIKNNDKYVVFEKRAPNLGYNQIYLDNLLENFLFFDLTKQNQIKGASTNDLSTVELVDLVRPSVTSIIHMYCLEVVNLNPDVSGLSYPKYNFCSTTKGSGFIIGENGIIATNGHVAKLYPEEGLVTQILSEGNQAFTKDLVKGVYLSKGLNPSVEQINDFYLQLHAYPNYLDRFLYEIYTLIDKKALSIKITQEKFYVNVGTEPVKIDYKKINTQDYFNSIVPSSTTYTATLIDANYPNKYSYDAIFKYQIPTGSDVALLKIDSSFDSFPVLELGNTNFLKEGEDVVIAGYPVLVEGAQGPKADISYKSSTKPTITRGIVSAIKQDGSGRKIIQTDASIDHGNSGGPAFNSMGQVIGIATFLFKSEGGNFNFLRDVSDVRDLLKKNNLQNNLDKLTTLWRQGLKDYKNNYYGQALKNFREVAKLSPSHPTIENFILQSEEAIKNGKSLEGFSGFIRGENSNILLLVFGGISIISFMSGGFLGVLPLFERKASI